MKDKPQAAPLARRKPVREPIIKNWRMLLVIFLLLFVAPPVATWLVNLVVRLVSGGS